MKLEEAMAALGVRRRDDPIDLGPLPDAEPYVRAERERSELPGRLARAEQERDAWKRLALASNAAEPGHGEWEEFLEAQAKLRELGIDPRTGERLGGVVG